MQHPVYTDAYINRRTNRLIAAFILAMLACALAFIPVLAHAEDSLEAWSQQQAQAYGQERAEATQAVNTMKIADVQYRDQVQLQDVQKKIDLQQVQIDSLQWQQQYGK